MQLETLIATHCSAVLLRRKPAALFGLDKRYLRSGELMRALSHHALRYTVLCDRCARALVLVFDEGALVRALTGETVRGTLAQEGYPVEEPLAAMLARLRARVRACPDFPHEIGFFLGYPAEDVIGFMRHKGKRCKLCGLWKVYGDVGRATAMFDEIHACRRHVLAHLGSGGSLRTLPLELAG